MEREKKRLTIDLDASFQRRLKARAAINGISMRQYCLSAIEKELTRDEARDQKQLPYSEAALDHLASIQAEVFQGRTLPGDSTDLIREARVSRAKSQ